MISDILEITRQNLCHVQEYITSENYSILTSFLLIQTVTKLKTKVF